MTDNNISSEQQYRAEISILNQEIIRLNEELEKRETEGKYKIKNKFDPFGNPTDYKYFSGDYSKIEPRVEEAGFSLPLEPAYDERKKLRKFYSIGGSCMIFHYFFVEILAYLIITVMLFFMSKSSPDASQASIYAYMKGSSIIVGLNTLIYLSGNLLFASIGMKRAGIRYTSLIRTNDFSFSDAVQYCMIGFFLWYISYYISVGISDIFSQYGWSVTSSNTSGIAQTTLGYTVMLFYDCIIAPITEEIFFRGMILRTFSKANQKFAIFASAFFFGMTHGNVPQFILAFILGIFLAHITLKHGSIIPSVIVHMFINSVSSAISETSSADIKIQFIINMVCIVSAILGLIMLFVFRASNRIPSTTPQQASRGYRVACGSWAFVAAAGLMIFDMLYDIINQNM